MKRLGLLTILLTLLIVPGVFAECPGNNPDGCSYGYYEYYGNCYPCYYTTIYPTTIYPTTIWPTTYYPTTYYPTTYYPTTYYPTTYYPTTIYPTTMYYTYGVSVSIYPTTQTVQPGQIATYTVTITNTGTQYDTYTLSTNYGTLSQYSISLWGGTSGSVTLTATAPSTAQTQYITVAASSYYAFDSESSTLVVQSTCSRNAPTVSISPYTQSGDPGQTLTYTVTVFNNDNFGCGSSTFSLSTYNIPYGWSAYFDSTYLTIIPGTSSTTNLRVTSSSSASSGSYSFTASAAHSLTGSATATYTISQLCTPSSTKNRICASLTSYQYEECSSDGTRWNFVTFSCPSGTTCSNGYCSSTTVCTPGETRNRYCNSANEYRYEQCNSEGSGWFTQTGSCPGNCYNGYCQGISCTIGETRNRVCDSSTTVRYEICESGNNWRTVTSYCSGGYCVNGYCSGCTSGYSGCQYSNYYTDCSSGYSGYSYCGYGSLSVNVKDCSNNNLISATVSLNPYYDQKYTSTGNVVFTNLRTGTYTVAASSTDYNTQSNTAVVYSGQTTTTDICLTRTQPAGNHCLRVEKMEAMDLAPDQTATINVEVSNCGTFKETNVKNTLKIFDKSYTYTISEIAPGEEGVASFSVNVPSSASGRVKAKVNAVNDYNNVAAEKSFTVLFGIPLVSVKEQYDVYRCEVSKFNFDVYNLGKADSNFKLSVTGDAAKWIYLSPDEIAIEGKSKETVTAYVSVPCGTDLGEYSFTVTAKINPESSATSFIRVLDRKGWTGMFIYPLLNVRWVWILFLLLLLVLFILVLWFLGLLVRPRRERPESFRRCG